MMMRWTWIRMKMMTMDDALTCNFMALSCSKIKRSLQLPCQEKKGKTLAKTGTELHTPLGILKVNPGERLSNSQSRMFGVLSEHEFETVFTRMTEDDRGFRFNQTSSFAVWYMININILYFSPLKINIEPEDNGLEDDFPFPGVYSQVPCQSSGVYITNIKNHIIPTTLPPAKI